MGSVDSGGCDMSETIEILAGERPTRDVNRDIREAVEAGNDVIVLEPLSRHNLGVGLPSGGSVRFAGSVGYYCGGLNTGAHITIDRNAGWGLGEGMSAGSVTTNGYSGLGTGAAMFGGLIHVKGSAGPRAGVAMKGGDIVVEGSVGFLSGFMAHAGRIIVLGDTEDAAGDSLWGGTMWVAGEIKSLGVDSILVDPPAEEVASVEELLATLGLADPQRSWKKIVSGQKLWHFESRDAQAWLMI